MPNIRWFLIKLLVGKSMLVMNANFNSSAIKKGYNMVGSHFDDSAVSPTKIMDLSLVNFKVKEL